MDGIVQNELFIGTELGIVSGFELSVLHMVIFHAHESSIIVLSLSSCYVRQVSFPAIHIS